MDLKLSVGSRSQCQCPSLRIIIPGGAQCPSQSPLSFCEFVILQVSSPLTGARIILCLESQLSVWSRWFRAVLVNQLLMKVLINSNYFTQADAGVILEAEVRASQETAVCLHGPRLNGFISMRTLYSN